MQDSIDGGANRHLDCRAARRAPAPPAPSPRLRRPGGGPPCSRRASCPCPAPAPSERLRDKRAVAGQHQIAEPAQARQRLELRAHRLAEPRHLGEAARDQRGGRVVAEAAALDDAGGDGEHVLHRAAQRHAQHVVRSSTAGRRRPPAAPASVSAERRIDGGDADRRRQAADRLLGEARARQHGDRPAGQHLASTSGISSPLEASMPLAQMTTGRVAGKPRRQLAHRLRRTDQQQRVAGAEARRDPAPPRCRRRAGCPADRPDWRDRARSPRRSPDRATTRSPAGRRGAPGRRAPCPRRRRRRRRYGPCRQGALTG